MTGMKLLLKKCDHSLQYGGTVIGGDGSIAPTPHRRLLA